jgi:DNA-directed RNA polymerase subunit beta
MRTHEVRDFSKRGDALPIPNLIHVQQTSYGRFLQKDVDLPKRKNEGLEALLREVFPIESYDGNLRLEYISYDLSEPRYTTDALHHR